MSNLCATTVKITGVDRLSVKRRFDESAVQTDFGCAWHLDGKVIRCDTQNGDGITVEPDAIIFKIESDWEPPLSVVQNLSQQYPGLTFEVAGTELTNHWSQRWIFEAGVGRLLECVQEADNDEPRIAYMLNGEQFLPLPEWVSATDELARSDTTNESVRVIPKQSPVVAERQQAETQLEDARRDSARRDLSELLSEGCDPHEACCMVIYDILHVDADVVAGDYVDSFLDWVFEGDVAERERWRAMVGANFNEVQKTHDFKKEGF